MSSTSDSARHRLRMAWFIRRGHIETDDSISFPNWLPSCVIESAMNRSCSTGANSTPPPLSSIIHSSIRVPVYLSLIDFLFFIFLVFFFFSADFEKQKKRQKKKKRSAGDEIESFRYSWTVLSTTKLHCVTWIRSLYQRREGEGEETIELWKRLLSMSYFSGAWSCCTLKVSKQMPESPTGFLWVRI